MKMKVSQIALFTVAGLALAGITSCKGKEEQRSMPAPQIATMTLSYGNSDLTSSYPATIKGKTDIQIRPQVTGFITKVHVDEGQRVSKGQPLFTIDQVQYQAAVDQAQAQVNSARTAVETARLTAEKKQYLYGKNIISEYENQLAQNQFAQAQSALATAEAALVNAKKNLGYTVVVAPSDGVVGSIPNREGSLASPSMAQPLTTVSDNSEVYAYFSLNEKDILKLTDNGATTLTERISEMPEVELQLADGTVFPNKGRVATVSGVIDNTTGAANVRAIFKNTNGMLRSGSTGQILIPNVEENVIIIPQKATFELQDRRFVYIVTDSNTVVSAPITVSPLSDGKTFIVTSGLQPGQRIAIEGIGTANLRDGGLITPVDAAAAQAPAAAEAPAAEPAKE